MKLLFAKVLVTAVKLFSPYVGKIFYIGLLSVPVSVFMFFLASEEVRKFEQFDAKPERVSFRDFVAGNYRNEHWFELSDFQVGEEIFTWGADSDATETVYLPLWPRSADPAAGPAPLVAQIHSVSKLQLEATIQRLSRSKILPIQFWNRVHTHVARMHERDPMVWSRHPIVVDINYGQPSLAKAWSFRLWGALWAVVALLALGFTLVIYRDVLGITKPREKKRSFQTRASGTESLTPFASNSLSVEFCRLGFEFSHTLRETLDRTTKDHHLHLSADRRLVLDLIETKEGTFPFLFAVCFDGTLLVLRPGEEAVDLDGAEFGVPIRVRGTQDFTSQCFVDTFHAWKNTLPQADSLVEIPPDQVTSVHRYYDRLIDWWVVFMGKSHKQPEAIPAHQELIHELNGKLVFRWEAGVESVQNEYAHA